MLKRDLWTNTEVITMLQGLLLCGDEAGFVSIHNAAIDDALDIFEEMAAGIMAYNTENRLREYVGPGLPEIHIEEDIDEHKLI